MVRRPDGRKEDELRSIRIEAGILNNADGSAYLEWGVDMYRVELPQEKAEKLKEEYPSVKVKSGGDVVDVDIPAPLKWYIEEEGLEVKGTYFKGNRVYAAVYGPREPIPRHEASPYRAIVRYRYSMAPFSVPERKSPKPSRRDVEISKISKEALQRVIFAEEYPMTFIDVFAEVVQADAGTRVAALTAASVALADAGIPMRDIPVALAVGRICIDGECGIVVDVNKEEEDAENAVDMPVAVLPRTGDILLLQMDGRVSKEELMQMFELALEKAKEISSIQREALKRKYMRVIE